MAILASVLGPVLAAVFVAELATEGHWRESSPAPRRQAPVADRDGGVTESAETIVQDTTAPGAGPSAADGEDGKPSKGKGKDGGASKGEEDDGPAPDPDDVSPSDPSGDSPSAPGGSGATHRPTTPPNPRPTAPATVVPTPTPTPTETCQRFLWWCT